MNQIEKLLRIKCPNGVEYKSIADIATDIYRGSGIRQDELVDAGIPCVRYGELYTTYGVWFCDCVSHTEEERIKTKKYFENGDILFAITGECVEDIAKSCAYVGHEKCLAGGDIVVLKHTQNPKYLSYVLDTEFAKKQKQKGKVKSKVVHSSVPDIKRIIIPIPPIEVQEEIVRVLDEYSENLNKLIMSMENEIDARKSQYSLCYKSLFQNNTEQLEELPLCRIADIGTGSSNTNEAEKDGLYPFFVRAQEPLRKNTYEFDEAATITAGDGVGVGRVFNFVNGKYALHQRSYRIHVNDPKILDLYLFYYFRCFFPAYIAEKQYEGSVASIRRPMLNDFVVRFPISLNKQEDIVNKAKIMDSTYHDLIQGIKDEIEMRKAQYSLFRDEILSFKGFKAE